MLVVHHGELELQGVVLAVGVVNENVFLGDAVFAYLHYFKPEAFLYESVFVVLAEYERLAVAYVDSVLLSSFLVIYRVVATIVEDDTVLENLAH